MGQVIVTQSTVPIILHIHHTCNTVALLNDINKPDVFVPLPSLHLPMISSELSVYLNHFVPQSV